MDVHPQQHLGPIVGVGAAVAGVDRQDRRVGVVRAAEQRFELQVVEHRLGPVELRRSSATKLGSSSPISTSVSISPSRDRLVERLEHGVQAFQLRDRGLGRLLVVPEIGGGHPLFDRCGLRLFGRVVKESPAIAGLAVRIRSARSVSSFSMIR